MTGSASGVSGPVEYDATVMCFSDKHDDGVHMIATDEQSDNGNDIFECVECGVRRAVNLRVVPVGGRD